MAIDFTKLKQGEQFALLARALRMAAHFHEGQTDKSGKPYLGHVVRVSGDGLRFSIHVAIVGGLHDLVEDTPVDLDMLRYSDFPEFIVEAVDAITHRPNEPHVEYMKRVMSNRLARKAKLCDFRDNASPERYVGDGRDEVRNARYCQGIRDILAIEGEFMSPDDIAYFEEPITAHYPHG